MKKILGLLCLLIMISSCVSKEKILYVQDVRENLPDEAINYHTTIKSDDLLRIIVSSRDPELVQDFNLFVNPVLGNDLMAQGNSGRLLDYLVDVDGTINFPVLGNLEVAGMTREEVRKMIAEKMRPYVSDVMVDVRIMNFKVSVLGEVNRPGTYTVNEGRLTLLQALGLAGDLTIYGDRQSVKILRDINGVQQSYEVDLTNTDFVSSDYYFLQQNDIIVVDPNKAQVQAAGFNRNASLFVSIASLLLSVIVILVRN
ncbi:polysaccharide biosynthesis/export family protein [Nonlabens xiamenensis]|uniref:polysaccharide biosynthesis/export family protein n=1 Tax=Nonlabens xiamenensis TaxID=2341043 RepID=UPI001F0B9E62|nr:polysaccharide biosynthesis/export family protein [Nonlabens xiamenensis]